MRRMCRVDLPLNRCYLLRSTANRWVSCREVQPCSGFPYNKPPSVVACYKLVLQTDLLNSNSESYMNITLPTQTMKTSWILIILFQLLMPLHMNGKLLLLFLKLCISSTLLFVQMTLAGSLLRLTLISTRGL